MMSELKAQRATNALVLKDIGELPNSQGSGFGGGDLGKVNTVEGSLMARFPSSQERALTFSFLDVMDIGRLDMILSTAQEKELWRDAIAGTHSPALSMVQYSEADDFKKLKWVILRKIMLENLKLKIRVHTGPELTQGVKQFDFLVKHGQPRIATFLLMSGSVDPNRTHSGYSLLHLACAQGLQDVVECLIDLGAKLDRKVTKTGATALHLASHIGNKGVMKALVVAGIDVNKLDKSKNTPLHLACAAGHIEAALYLVQQAGADFEIANNDGATPIFVASGSASTNSTAVMIVQTLVQAGADLNRGTKDGSTPLAAASRAGDFEAVECLLEGGADVNKRDKNGVSPLYLACEEGHLRCSTILLREGAQFERPSADGGTPLGVASQNGHTSTVEALIAAGAEVDKANASSNYTPLHLACLGGHAATAEVLLQSGAAINCKAKGGKDGSTQRGEITPLGCALEVKSNAVVTLLRSKGAHT